MGEHEGIVGVSVRIVMSVMMGEWVSVRGEWVSVMGEWV